MMTADPHPEPGHMTRYEDDMTGHQDSDGHGHVDGILRLARELVGMGLSPSRLTLGDCVVELARPLPVREEPVEDTPGRPRDFFERAALIDGRPGVGGRS